MATNGVALHVGTVPSQSLSEFRHLSFTSPAEPFTHQTMLKSQTIGAVSEWLKFVANEQVPPVVKPRANR